jgi:hypothetical protein
VPPVDDVDARGSVDERRAPDEHVALDVAAARDALAQAQVPEVGRRRVDQERLQIRARRRHFLQALHLRDQRRYVFQARLADLVAQRDHLIGIAAPSGGLVLPAARRPPSRRLPGRQAGEGAREQPLLLGRDAVGRSGVGMRFGALRHGRRLHDDLRSGPLRDPAAYPSVVPAGQPHPG